MRDERAYYRLKYPLSERPTIRIEDRDFEVSEVSEKGARIVLVGEFEVRQNQTIAGVLSFRDGESISVAGEVVRTHDEQSHKEFVLVLTDGISLKRMIAEQMRLQKKYPAFLGIMESDKPTGSRDGKK